MLRIHDADTGESSMDVVAVPEGFSFQVCEQSKLDSEGFISVIVNPVDAEKLIYFLQHRKI